MTRYYDSYLLNTMLQVSQTIQINASTEEVFDFHADLNNISSIIPSFIKIQIEKLEWPFEKNAEAILSFSFFGLIKLFDWRLKLTEYQKPNYFIDQEIGGLFKFFAHKHEFIFESPQSTLVCDTISYKVLPYLDPSLFKWVFKIFLQSKLKNTKKFIESRKKV